MVRGEEGEVSSLFAPLLLACTSSLSFDSPQFSYFFSYSTRTIGCGILFKPQWLKTKTLLFRILELNQCEQMQLPIVFQTIGFNACLRGKITFPLLITFDSILYQSGDLATKTSRNLYNVHMSSTSEVDDTFLICSFLKEKPNSHRSAAN